MKHTSITLILLLVTIMIGCTKIDEVLNDDSSKGDTNNLLEEIDPSLSDTIRNMQISFFQSNLEKDSIKKAKWDSISLLGAIPIDSIKVVRIDTNNWCYILPVLNQDSLIGIIKATILEDEIKNDHLYQIKMGSQSEMSTPKFISPTDSLFCSLSGYYNIHKNISTFSTTRMIPVSGLGAYYPYRYKLNYHNTIEGDEIVVTGGSKANIAEGIEYFRFHGAPIRDYILGNEGLTIYFVFINGFDYNTTAPIAYEFALTLNFWLQSNGYEVFIMPAFIPDNGGRIPNISDESTSSGDNKPSGGVSGNGIPNGGNNSKDEDSEEKKETFSIELSVPPKAINLGENYDLSIKVTPFDEEISRVEYNIIAPIEQLPLPLCSTNSFTGATSVRAYRPGSWEIEAIAYNSEGCKATSTRKKITIQNPSYYTIMNSENLSSQMMELWEMTVLAAESDPASYVVIGGWIVLDTHSNIYTIAGVSKSWGWDYEGGICLDSPVPKIPVNLPNQGGDYIVGYFHTHPPRSKCDSTQTYPVGPTKNDRSINTVCLIYDYVGNDGQIQGGHSPRDDYKLYHFGTDINNPLGKVRQPLDFIRY